MKNKEKILEILACSPHALSSLEVFNLLNKEIDLSTVYRNLTSLTNSGVLAKQIRFDKTAYYQLNEHHKHVLICQECKEEVELDECPIEAINHEIENKTGFTITSHNIELVGLCAKCSKKQKKA